jgi:hypothetical protein
MCPFVIPRKAEAFREAFNYSMRALDLRERTKFKSSSLISLIFMGPTKDEKNGNDARLEWIGATSDSLVMVDGRGAS